MSIRTVVFVLLAGLAGVAGALGIAQFWHNQKMEKLAREQNRQRADGIVDLVLLRTHWVSLETNEKFKNDVVVKLARSLGIPEGADGTIVAIDQQSGVVTIDLGNLDGLSVGHAFAVFEDLDDVAAASSTRKGTIEVTSIVDGHKAEAKITEQKGANPIQRKDRVESSQFRYRWDVIRSAANRRDNKGLPKNKWEEELLMRFAQPPVGAVGGKGESQLFADQIDAANQEYHYYKPIYLAEDCVACHRISTGNPALKEGDLQSIIRVRLPLKR